MTKRRRETDPDAWLNNGIPTSNGPQLKASLSSLFGENPPARKIAAAVSLYIALEQAKDPDNLLFFRAEMNEIDLLVPELIEEHKSPFEQLEGLAIRTGADGFFMTSTTKNKYTHRYVISSENVHLLQRPPKESPLMLTIVSGSSGSGKTWFMLNSKSETEIGVYLTQNELEFVSQKNEDISRDLRVRTCLFAAIRKVLNEKVLDLLKRCEPPNGLFIVLDEMGSLPQFVRGLCSQAESLEKMVQAEFGLRIPCDFMVGGTGADGGVVSSIGSQSTTHQVLRLPVNSDVWDALAKKLEENKQAQPKRKQLLKALQQNRSALLLAQTPRVAALMFRAMDNARSSFWNILGNFPSERAIKNSLPLFLAEVAKTFRGLNAMNAIDTTEEIVKIYRQALTLLLFPSPAAEEALEASEITQRLVVDYGVIVDGAYLKGDKREDVLEAGKFQVLGRRDDGREVRAPLQRYTMPPAQVELFRLGYGLELGQPTTAHYGEGFEGVLAQFLESLLLAAHGRSLGQFLAKLGSSKVQPEEEKVKLSYTGISVVQSSIRVDPGNLQQCSDKEEPSPSQDDDWYEQIRTQIAANNSVVLINGAKRTSFADLIVLIPNTVVILIQTRYYDEQTLSLSATDVQLELLKMGHPALELWVDDHRECMATFTQRCAFV